jgi:erythromycin esterase-like protein
MDYGALSYQKLTGAADDYDALLQRIGGSSLVLLGEASHGTHEFYRDRANITRRLIQEKGFTAVAVEADWPDAYRVNRYVQNRSGDTDPDEALSGFLRFPTWMWRNTVVLEFVDWLRAHNDSQIGRKPKAGFYGLDLYSMYKSIEEVLKYLDRVDPEAAKRARYRYSCFDHLGEDPQSYGYAASFGMSKTCEEEVLRTLGELTRRAGELARKDGGTDELFYAEQNARLVKNAEEYYRNMFGRRVSSWNLRDRHMVETLEALRAHLATQLGEEAKVVLWAHNSHLGDARETEMGQRGELNVGQLVRERHGHNAYLVGFMTHHGSVTAASDWGAPPERKRVRPGLPNSYESLLHGVDTRNFVLFLEDPAVARALPEQALERAIGVIYLPESERVSHYFDARLARQFDALVYFDQTQALEPLERLPQIVDEPETFPSGI